MADLVGIVLEPAVSELKKAIKKTWYFKSQLTEMKTRVEKLRPYAEHLKKLNTELDRPKEETEGFVNLLNQAKDLGMKCEEINWQFWKICSYSSKIDEMNELLKEYILTDLHLQTSVKVAEISVVVQKGKLEKGSPSGVPVEKCVAIGFADRLVELKPMVLKDSPDNDCSVTVVSAAGGSGKTTLVRMLCQDPEIQGKFGKNIYHATIPEKYDIKVIIKRLLPGKQEHDFYSDDDAIEQWGSFVRKKNSPLLLVLDDVRSDSIILKLKFKLPGYKILVTSRKAFTQFKTYKLPGLNDHDATCLFHRSAFSDEINTDIPKKLVEELVERCKNHPLSLTVIGGSLKGSPVTSWILMSENLSKGKKSFSTFHESIQECLLKSFYLFNEEPKIKQCYMDLGLFPEDQKISATTLMDMWTQLYEHDADGVKTSDTLTTLSSRNLATFMPKRKNLPIIAHHCEEGSITQHDMMRELAIHLSSQDSLERRERLILNTDGEDLPQFPEMVNARIVSISTGVATNKGFPLTWDEIQAPKVEVLLLNFMSNTHSLPRFMQSMKGLKVLIITNYGYYFSEIQNFHASQCLSGLTKLRLDHVSISSIIKTILELENLKKLSLIMCKIGDSFKEAILIKLTNLSEIDIESCDDLITFPAMLCNLAGLKKLCITNCHELVSLSKEFGNLSNLEVLRLASCSKISALPESMKNLKKLRIIDLSHCLNLHQLPLDIGELVSLQTIIVTGCTGLSQPLPESIRNLNKVKVVCDEETSHLWKHFKNVELQVVEEDTLDTFFKIIPKGFM